MTDIFLKWIILIGQIILVGLLLGLIKKASGKMLNNSGKYKIRSVSSFVGTPIHEFGHFIFAILFGFKVHDAQFFPSKIRDNGDGTVTLGFVKWSAPKYRITNSIGMLFVGIGPFISGTLVIVLLTYFLEPDLLYAIKHKVLEQPLDLNFFQYFYNTIKIILDSALEQKMMSFRFIIYIILISMIAIHMNLSAPDIKTSLIGLAEVSVFVGLISIIAYYNTTVYTNVSKSIVQISFISSAVLSLCFICQCIYLFISFIRSEI